MTKFLIAASAFFGCLLAQAKGPTSFPSPDAFVKSIESKVFQSAHGDLNGDGLEDWIGAVAPTSLSDEDSSMNRIIVLLQKSPGHYVLAGNSRPFSSSDLASDAANFDIEIKKATFYVSFRSYSRRCITASRAQFRLEDNAWRMIGATYRESNTTEGKLALWYTQDANLVTGDEILIVKGSVKERRKFSPLVLDLQEFPLEYNKAFRTKPRAVCG
jgi:hypothetical protein